MGERREGGVEWWVFSVLAAVALGWWLAVRTLALRIGAVAGVVAPVLSDGSGSPSGGGAAVPPTPNGEVLTTIAAVATNAARVPLEDRADDYLTVKELEGYLPLCGKSIRREIAEGRLPSYKLRGKLTVKGSDAHAWLLARKEGGFNAKNAEGAVS